MPSRPRKRALVTGAGTGIGRAVAIALLRSGFDVALAGRREAPLRAVATFAAPLGGSAVVLPFDLSDRLASDAALEELAGTWPALHAVVLNAGGNAPTPLDAPDTGVFDRLVETNLVAPLRVLRALLDHLADGASVVAVASILGRFGVPDYHGYCASKAGLIGLVRSLALELAPRRITVNAAVPGWVDTAMAERAIAAQAPGMGLRPEEAREAFLGEVPLGRMLEPDEVAALVLYLVGPAARGLTGQAIDIDCGVTA